MITQLNKRYIIFSLSFFLTSSNDLVVIALALFVIVLLSSLFANNRILSLIAWSNDAVCILTLTWCNYGIIYHNKVMWCVSDWSKSYISFLEVQIIECLMDPFSPHFLCNRRSKCGNCISHRSLLCVRVKGWEDVEPQYEVKVLFDMETCSEEVRQQLEREPWTVLQDTPGETWCQ